MASDDIDRDALTTSQKILSITFIILIGALNLWLLVRLLFRSGKTLFQSPQKYLVVSLALGDLLLALFPLVVYARNVFEDFNFDDDCKLTRTSVDYEGYYFPFVYGMGLFFLSIELIKRKAIRAIGGSATLASVIYCAVPWLLGLVIILPLCWAGIDWDDCTYTDFTFARARAREAVAVVVPSILAVIGIIAVTNSRPEPLLDHDVGAPDDARSFQLAGSVIASVPSIELVHKNTPVQYSATPSYATGPQPYSHQWFQNQSVPPGYYRPGQPGQPAPPPLAQPTTYNIPAQHQPQLYAPFVSPPPASGSDTIQRNIQQEKDILVKCFVFYITFMLPYTLFKMIMLLNDDPPHLALVPFVSLQQGLYWLSLFRGVVLPIVWLKSPTLTNNA